MIRFEQRYGPWALVTGASSGLGAEIARQLAGRGCDLVLVARRERRLAAVARQCAQRGARTRVVAVDLTRPDLLATIEAATADLEIGLLVNNAGFALTGPFLEQASGRQQDLLAVNCRAPLALIHFFGRRMAARGRGGVVNVSSLTAVAPMPQWALYAASKAFLRSLSEALWFELGQAGIDVVAVCPGATRTEFARVARVRGGGMTPEVVVRQSLDALGRGPSRVTGWRNRLRAVLLGALPRRKRIAMGAKIVSELRQRPSGAAEAEGGA